MAQEPLKASIPEVMISEEGKEVNGLADKLKILSEYYAHLYKSRHPSGGNRKSFLNDIPLQEITMEAQQGLNAEISYSELELSINQMKLGKAPSPNGLSTEFYTTFKKELLPHLLDLIQYCYLENNIPPSWRQARLVLIPKEGKDHSLPTAYRP